MKLEISILRSLKKSFLSRHICINLFFISIFSFGEVTCSPLAAQTATHEGEAWAAYISTIRLSKRLAIWNDFHFVTHTFYVSRHGLTWSLTPQLDISGGYAWVITSTSFSDRLLRPEHRPWGQVVFRAPLTPKISFQGRFRYDARFRKQLQNGAVIDEWGFNNRLRLMARLRFQLKELPRDWRLHADVMDEILFNTGRQVKQGIDQNRSFFLLGLTHKNLTLLGGYCLRALPGMEFKHGATVWVVHTISLKSV